MMGSAAAVVLLERNIVGMEYAMEHDVMNK